MGRFVGKEADGPAPPWIGRRSIPSPNDLSGNEELAEGAAI